MAIDLHSPTVVSVTTAFQATRNPRWDSLKASNTVANEALDLDEDDLADKAGDDALLFFLFADEACNASLTFAGVCRAARWACRCLRPARCRQADARKACKSSLRRRAAACRRLQSSPLAPLALTLEACLAVTALSVPPGVRLRALVLRCCHDLAIVDVADASALRSFEYRGGVLAGPRFLTLNGGPLRISLCTLDFCGEEAMDTSHLDGLEGMLRLFVGVDRLQLTSARLGCGVASLSPSAFPAFTKLRQLELTGMLPEDDATAINVVTRILERTPNLETLSLFFMPEPEPETENEHYGHAEELQHGHKMKYDEHASLVVPAVDIPCLREKIKEINFVHYQGGIAQRMLAKFLLCNAPDVQEVCGEFASGPLFVQIKLMEEIKGWVMNKSANMMFF